jgi:serine/threonine protein kinase/tetratricopeptide (TPR) repeat protein
VSHANPLETAPLEELVGRVADEFTQRLDRGERPDVEEFARLHPQIADVLREVLPALEVFRVPAPGQGAPEQGGDPAEDAPGTLGDYRLLRVVGRGGMGVVYEAEQQSLGRRVAVKVLPFAATLDGRHLQRFRDEARAAALLHHTHIVPVYGMGSDRGVSYYAMQFIDGQTLAEVIAGLRRDAAAHPRRAGEPPAGTTALPPAAVLSTERSHGGPAFYRSVARLGVQAAEALAHAHESGVIHRDIKPSNLLLDGAGHLWITDFGLARFPDEPGLTRTGDVVGTLRYMSPEQALGKPTPVDRRSDVYALGATLYELLTLEPAYPGRDRDELLRQIATSEPKEPRRLDPAVPRELETVVLKAMAREPERRYATAEEFADDLRCFLEHRPVKARRPSLAERVAKFARRHRAATAAAVVVLALAAAALCVTTVVVWREKEQTEAARGREEAQRRRADANFQRALSGATQLLLPLEDERLKDVPGVDALRQKLVSRGVLFFEGFVHPNDPEPAVRFDTAQAYHGLAATYSAHQQAGAAREVLGREVVLLEALTAAYPEQLAYRRQLARAHDLTARLATSTDQGNQAREEYCRVIEQYRLALPYDAGADTLNNYAWLLADCPEAALRDPARAVALARQATERAPERAPCWNTLGVAYYRAGEWQKAIAALEKSCQTGAGGDPWDWFFLAMANWQLGNRAEAAEWYEKADRRLRETVPKPEELSRYRAEARAVLGVTETTPTDGVRSAGRDSRPPDKK